MWSRSPVTNLFIKSPNGSVRLSLEEDHAEHLSGRVDGRPSSSVSRVAAAHAPTR